MTADLRESIIRLHCATALLPPESLVVVVVGGCLLSKKHYSFTAEGELEAGCGSGKFTVNIDRTTRETLQQCQC